MSRVKRGVTTHARHKKIIKRAKGFRGRSKNCFRIAIERTEKALQYQYRDRRTRKRDFRKLWIQRINAGVRQYDMRYSEFINGLALAGIEINRKVLSELAVHDEKGFKALVDAAAKALKGKKPAAEKKAA